jgi:hypothetical protein
MFETIEASFGGGVGNFVLIASAGHPLLQVTQSFGDLWALLYWDRWMIQW